MKKQSNEHFEISFLVLLFWSWMRKMHILFFFFLWCIIPYRGGVLTIRDSMGFGYGIIYVYICVFCVFLYRK